MIYDVVIAGAGPVGLWLACELRLADVSVLVLEQADDPGSPLKRAPFGTRGLSIPTVEAWHRRGLLEELTAPVSATTTSGENASPSTHGKGAKAQAGHFAGIPIDHRDIDTSGWLYRLPGPAESPVATDMERVEMVLTRRAVASGVDIRRGHGVVDVEPAADDVTVHTHQGSFRARWLVGCDGGRSVVRKRGGFDFVGTEPAFTGYSVEVDMADPDLLPMGRHYTPTGMYFQSRPGTIALVDFDGGAVHRSAPVTLEHMQIVLRRVSGVDVVLTALHVATTWTDRAKQAPCYRKGRVLLAGDAAHIHSPLGGQGLNLGLGDAMNLGWKLAATIRNHASASLLDSYTRERHPVGAAVLDWSRAQVALMQPSRHSRALEAIVRDLIGTRDGATYFAERAWGVSLSYDLGNGHPLVGRSAPDFAWDDGTRLGERLRDGNGLLLNFGRYEALRAIGGLVAPSLAYIDDDVRDDLGLKAVLVRPDGIVAWATDGEPDIAALRRALTTWWPHLDLQ